MEVVTCAAVSEMADSQPLEAFQKQGCPDCGSFSGSKITCTEGSMLWRCECGIGRFLTWEEESEE